MRLQVLVSTMYQKDYSLLDRMNIQTDAIVINQCDCNQMDSFLYKGHTIQWISLAERGVGLSRNTAFMRADADIVLFADDDVVYQDGYAEAVLKTFSEHPKASLIMFNLRSLNSQRPEYIVKKEHRLRWYNCLKYGAVRIAVRREAIQKKNLMFSLFFGGGAKYQAGEDNLFVTKCLQAGIVGVASTVSIGTVKQEDSTWFNGYTEKYYYDRGALFAAMYGKWAKLLLLLIEIKNCSRKSEIPFNKRFRLEQNGMDSWK